MTKVTGPGEMSTKYFGGSRESSWPSSGQRTAGAVAVEDQVAAVRGGCDVCEDLVEALALDPPRAGGFRRLDDVERHPFGVRVDEEAATGHGRINGVRRGDGGLAVLRSQDLLD